MLRTLAGRGNGWVRCPGGPGNRNEVDVEIQVMFKPACGLLYVFGSHDSRGNDPIHHRCLEVFWSLGPSAVFGKTGQTVCILLGSAPRGFNIFQLTLGLPLGIGQRTLGSRETLTGPVEDAG